MKKLIQISSFLFLAAHLSFAQWVQTNGLDSVGVFTLAVRDTNLFAGGCQEGVFLSSNGGQSWVQVNVGLTNTCIFSLFVCGTDLFASTLFGGVFLSTDNGSSWALINSLPIDTTITCFTISGTSLFAGASSTYPGTEGGVYRSDDNGTTWIPVNDGFPPYRNVNAIVTIPNGTGGTNLCVGVSVCDTTCHGSIYHSTNNGTNWNQVSTEAGSGGPLCVSGQNIFSGTGSNILRSSDNGKTWTQVNSWPLQYHIKSFGVSGTNIFAGSIKENSNDGLLFLSTDDGTSWISVNEGLPPDKWVTSFATVGNNVFVGTLHSGGVWRRPLSEMITEVESASRLPKKFSLEQNYPNPFNPSTTFRYSIPTQSKVVIKVYDVLGNEIATLMDEEKSIGTYELTWNAEQLPSGVYFYQIKAGEFIQTKKMLLLK